MATESMLADVGILYKRLFNHRPIIQNEVHYFVKEFESKREDNDQKTLQDAMLKADEINNVFLNEILYSNSHFKNIKEKAKIIKDTAEKILSEGRFDLWVSPEEQSVLDKEVEEYQIKFKESKQDVFSVNEQEVERLKKEINDLREARVKTRSYVSSISSSVTIYPVPSSVTPSPEEQNVGDQGEGAEVEGVKEEEEEQATKTKAQIEECDRKTGDDNNDNGDDNEDDNEDGQNT